MIVYRISLCVYPIAGPTSAVHYDITPEFMQKVQEFRKFDSELISNINCCAFCGQCSLGGSLPRGSNFTTMDPLDNFPPNNSPYGIANELMRQHTFDQVTRRWFRCSSCKDNPAMVQRMRQTVLMAPNYLRQLLAAHPLHVQLLSVIDASVNFNDRFGSFRTGQLQPRQQLLSSPLISFGQRRPLNEGSLEQLGALLKTLKGNKHPVLERYQTLLERGGSDNNAAQPAVEPDRLQHVLEAPGLLADSPFTPGENPMAAIYQLAEEGVQSRATKRRTAPTLASPDASTVHAAPFDRTNESYGVPWLPSSTVNHILEKTREEGAGRIDGSRPIMPSEDPQATINLAEHVTFAVALDVEPPFQQVPYNQVYAAGVLADHGPEQLHTELLTNGIGLPVNQSRASAGALSLTLELAIFTALFPWGEGAFNSAKSRFGDYLR